jgi:hypothetical protein
MHAQEMILRGLRNTVWRSSFLTTSISTSTEETVHEHYFGLPIPVQKTELLFEPSFIIAVLTARLSMGIEEQQKA